VVQAKSRDGTDTVFGKKGGIAQGHGGSGKGGKNLKPKGAGQSQKNVGVGGRCSIPHTCHPGGRTKKKGGPKKKGAGENLESTSN